MAKTHRLDHEPFLVEPGKKYRLSDCDPDYTAGFKDKAEAREALLEDVSGLAEVQDKLWACKTYSVIIIFQALDAAGKDGTIKHVMSGVNPQGVNVYSFKAPTEDEKLRSFLWRPMRVLPALGQMAIFNRSYYEEVLVVRVHPEFLNGQLIPNSLRNKDAKQIWQARYDEINAFEKSLVHYNTCILKFFLNVSKAEQKKRFLARLDDPAKNWKFSAADVRERAFWNDYQQAYEDMLSATSTEKSPWYVIPADKKWFTRACVADIITTRLADLDLQMPEIGEKEKLALVEAKRQLESEKD